MKQGLRIGLAVLLFISPAVVHAGETLSGALAKAYENNSSLNSARAGLRVVNEGVPLAKSGWRPRVTGTIALSSVSADAPGVSQATFGIEINQTIFDGWQTRNNVQAAEARVRAERQNLRNTEQNTLFDAAQIFMDVVQNRQIEGLRARNLEFLREQLRAARARFEVGEGTRTDVAQAEASLSSAQAQLTSARAQLGSSEALYRQIVGTSPGPLKSPGSLGHLLPASLGQAETIAFRQHPAIRLRDALIDAGVFSVKSAEGAFLPQVSLSAGVSETYSNRGSGLLGQDSSVSNRAEIGAQVRIPIYQGGQASATVRQNKESLGQARIDRDVARDQVRAAVTSAWTQLQAARAQLTASRETVRAQRLALDGVVEERNVGQRTTLDVLNAQALLIDAQVSEVQARRNIVVAEYGLVSATGKLDAKRLSLRVAKHEPEQHYNQVKDAWFGLRTPDGR